MYSLNKWWTLFREILSESNKRCERYVCQIEEDVMSLVEALINQIRDIKKGDSLIWRSDGINSKEYYWQFKGEFGIDVKEEIMR